MYYSRKEICASLQITTQAMENTLFLFQITPSFRLGQNSERYYSIYQVELFKEELQRKSKAKKIQFDFIKNEIYTIYESKINKK